MNKKRLSIIITVLLTFFICTGMILDTKYNYGDISVFMPLYWGSKGSKVSEVQRKLRQWGYYDGPIDGRYGGGTFKAVKKFQKKNGLRQDGIVGKKTAAALGIPWKQKKATTYQSSRGGGGDRGDVYLLARAIHGEARGEPYVGKVAVAAVILNRTKHPSFPNTIAGVIYQPGAFTAVSDGQLYLQPNAESIRAARDALNGWDPSGGALYYYNPAKTTSSWIWSRTVHTVIGRHKFAK